MSGKLRQHTLMLIVGQRAERQYADKMRAKEAEVMHTQLRSSSRLRHADQVDHETWIGRHKRWARRLQEDAHECQLNLKVATAGCFRRQDIHNTRRLQQLMGEYDRYKGQVHAFQQQKELLSKQISATEKEIRLTMQKISERKLECRKCPVPKPEKVETRLELACTKFGKQLETNRALVDEMKHLTMERALVIKTYKRLEMELATLSIELAGHIEVASDMYNQQDATKRAMCKLQEHFEKSAEQFEGQMNNYNSGIDALKRIEKFVMEKSKHRPDANGRERRRQLRDQLTATEKENLMYQSVVQQIRTVLGDEELNEIIDTFIELVEENYMLFKNVAEYRGRVRDAKCEIENVKGEIANVLSQSIREDEENRLQKAELIEKRKICKNAAEDIERKIEHADSIIQSYITGVLIILYNLDYTESEIKELAGVLGKVEERNVLQFLGEIERNINKLVGIQDYVEFTEYFRRKARSPIMEAILPRHSRQRPVSRAAIVVPAMYDGDEDDHLPADADRRPFNREEILDYVLTDVETQEALASREAVRDVRPTISDAVSDITVDEDDSNISPRPADTDVF